jgi:hypothetical protein
MEELERRETPALFGVPWTDPTHLTLSFASDGTSVAGTASNLQASLGANYAAFQATILRAAQTWAAQANVTISVVSDSGAAFGSAGPTQHDPRFGDIRIGGRAIATSAAAVAVPPDPFLSGTWAGDIVFNTSVNWSRPAAKLFNVALHEVGHALGLAENHNPHSVMDANLAQAPSVLSARDVRVIQALYGPRPTDRSEGSNGSFARATNLDASDGAPAFAFGDITTNADADVYRFQADAAGPVTVRLLTSGISLLRPRVTVYDEAGNVLARGTSTDPPGGVVSLTFDATGGGKYFVKVEGATRNVFGIGRYGLAVTPAGAGVPTDQIDAFLRGPYDSLSPSDIQKAWEDPSGVLVNDDGGGDGGPGGATKLTPAGAGRFTATGSLNGPGSADYYRVVTPAVRGPATLVAAVTAFGPNGIVPQLELYDAAGNRVAADVVANGAGGFAIQAAGLRANKQYVVRVVGGTAGNYQLVVDTNQAGPLVTDMAAGTLAAATPAKRYDFYVAQSQLFHFALAAGAQSGVQMTVLDSTGATVLTLSAAAGQTASGTPALLAPGHYTVRFEATDPLGAAGTSFRLRGATVSDPVGPVLVNPSSTPQYLAPNPPSPTQIYLYPGGFYSATPYFWLAKIL